MLSLSPCLLFNLVSYPEGEPAHSLILNLKLVNRVLAPLQAVCL